MKNKNNQISKLKKELFDLINQNPLLNIELKRLDKDNLCDPPIEYGKALDILINYLLGESWAVSISENHKQVMFAAVSDILLNYSHKYKKEIKKYHKLSSKLSTYGLNVYDIIQGEANVKNKTTN